VDVGRLRGGTPADEPVQRLLLIFGSVPAGVAAVAIAAGGWAALAAAMALAAALWWLYFDSIAELNLKVLELSGGSPMMARAIFAVGHMLPSFALLITAAGLGQLLEGEPPETAYWLTCVGIGLYMLGTRAFMMGSERVPRWARLLVVIATFNLARLDLDPHPYFWLVTLWVIGCAALTTRFSHDDQGITTSLTRVARDRSAT
jgi:low temperature requirement protein LtrA